MRDKLRDPIWQLVVGVVAILITILIFRLQQSRKEITYEIISQTPLVTSQNEVKGRLQIFFDGNVVEDVTLVVLRLHNSGNVPVLRSDYDTPISFGFGQNAKILSAKVTKDTPRSVQTTTKIADGSVELSPILMNGGDVVDLKIIVASYSGAVNPDGRVVGVSQILQTKINDMSILEFVIMLLGLVGSSFLSVVGLRALYKDWQAEKIDGVWLFGFVVNLAMLGVAFGVWYVIFFTRYNISPSFSLFA